MKKYSILFFCFVMNLFPGFRSNSVFAENVEELYKQANKAYLEQRFDQARETYLQILEVHPGSAEVHYNLANTYYRLGQIPNAILHYEKSLKENPEDEDVKFNLRVANQRTVDRIDPIPDIFYKRWFRSLSELMEPGAWSKFFVLLIWLFFAACTFYAFSAQSSGKKAGFMLMIVTAVLSLLVFILLRQSNYYRLEEQHAIVMAASVYVKSSPDDRGTDLFIIHEGTKVELLDELSSWKKIKIANGSIGWIRSDQVETI